MRKYFGKHYGRQESGYGYDSDITTCEPEKISDAKVLGTMIGGEEVYSVKIYRRIYKKVVVLFSVIF
jgi:hypothetical protein